MKHNDLYCPEYLDKVLPNENGNCSLCNAQLVDERAQKVFLATYKIFEGEHDRYEKLLIRAVTEKEAVKIAGSQEHEPTIKGRGKALTWWDYGDGSTGATYKWIEEIDAQEAEILVKHNVAHYFTI